MIDHEKIQPAADGLAAFLTLFAGSDAESVHPEYARGAAELFHALFGSGETEDTVRAVTAMAGVKAYADYKRSVPGDVEVVMPEHLILGLGGVLAEEGYAAHLNTQDARYYVFKK